MNQVLARIGLLAVLSAAGCSPQVGTHLVYEVDRSGLEADQKVDSDALVTAVQRRIDRGWKSLGKARLLPDGRVGIDVYGRDAKQLELVKSLLGHTYLLEFRIVANSHDHGPIIAKAKASQDRRVVEKVGDGAAKVVARWVKTRKDVASGMVSRDDGGRGVEVLIVEDDIDLTGQYVRKASTSSDARGLPNVSFGFDSVGTRKMSELTTTNLPESASGHRRQLAIILDDELITAPTINSTIHDRAKIAGTCTRADTETLAAVLHAGPFPAPLKLVSETAVAK